MAGHSVPVDFRVNPAKISNPGKKAEMKILYLYICNLHFSSGNIFFTQPYFTVKQIHVLIPDLFFS